MKPQNELALIVAYYLSRLDRKGYSALGYKNYNEAAKRIGTILDVKLNTIKNRIYGILIIGQRYFGKKL
jgi:sporulation protein YlmC with PRC-barrel domain